jgi:hypothetical protein
MAALDIFIRTKSGPGGPGGSRTPTAFAAVLDEHFPAFVEMCERHDMGAPWMLALCTARRESELLGLR